MDFDLTVATVRYGKSYDSVEEIRRRFSIFVDSLRLIRSSNRKGRSYTLGINRELSFPFL